MTQWGLDEVIGHSYQMTKKVMMIKEKTLKETMIMHEKEKSCNIDENKKKKTEQGNGERGIARKGENMVRNKKKS